MWTYSISYCQHLNRCVCGWHQVCRFKEHFKNVFKITLWLSIETKGYHVCSEAWNRAVGHTFDTHEANTRHWRNDWNSIVSYKATTKYFMGPKKGWYLQVDETVLVCAGEVHAKGLPATCCAMQLKAGEIAKTLGIHNKIQSNKRLVWLVHAGSRTVFRHPTWLRPVLPIDNKQKTAVALWEALCHWWCCGRKSGSKELDSEYAVTVIT